MSPNGKKATQQLPPFLPGSVVTNRDDFRYSYYTLLVVMSAVTIGRSLLAKHRFLDHDLLSAQFHEGAHDCGYDGYFHNTRCKEDGGL